MNIEMDSPTLTTQDRDQLILDRHIQGNTLTAIGKEVNISRERVRQIVRRAALKEKHNKASLKLLKQIRQVNDIDRPFNRDALLTAIEYPHKVRRLLDWHFYPTTKKVSMRQLMDWCLPKMADDSSDLRTLYDWLPAYWIRGFAQYNVGDLIRYIDKIDFGQAFAKEWKKRRDAFRKKFKESGERALV
jgi:hypothetical protein